eukprot:CAMPEP_0171255624 /NCGR_PEP_ID=MMETSP0790-20130122/52865_1 /TAXON_ID=2925 /ORGANISM="Alexandrium catenella, Strain OF101" /LENGTH=142 /DNA_ID=CAMNT_0011723587 /DNA_START=124 /DNA_END=548 /DNA_ORIENTATION=-
MALVDVEDGQVRVEAGRDGAQVPLAEGCERRVRGVASQRLHGRDALLGEPATTGHSLGRLARHRGVQAEHRGHAARRGEVRAKGQGPDAGPQQRYPRVASEGAAVPQALLRVRQVRRAVGGLHGRQDAEPREAEEVLGRQDL